MAVPPQRPNNLRLDVVPDDSLVASGREENDAAAGRVQTVLERLGSRVSAVEDLSNASLVCTGKVDNDRIFAQGDWTLTDLFELSQIQELQDAFADAVGVVSIITDPNGTPLTKASNCDRAGCGAGGSEGSCVFLRGLLPDPGEPAISSCPDSGLWSGGVSVFAGNLHLANWIIGHLGETDAGASGTLPCGLPNGARQDGLRGGLEGLPSMSASRFRQVCRALFVMANGLSDLAYRSYRLARQMNAWTSAGRQTAQVMPESDRSAGPSLDVSRGRLVRGIDEHLQEVLETVDGLHDGIERGVLSRDELLDRLAQIERSGLLAVKLVDRLQGRDTEECALPPRKERKRPSPKAEAAIAGPAARREAERRLLPTILLCDDEPAIRGLTKQILDNAGYRTLVAADGPEALDLAAGQSDPIDLLVTDVLMPRMNGKELSDRLQARQPGVRTLYVSGYTAGVIASQGILDEGVDLVEKPFNPRTLLARIRKVLAQRAGTSRTLVPD